MEGRSLQAIRLVDEWKVPVYKNGRYGDLFSREANLKSAGYAGAISFGIQLHDDWDNPQLSGGQKFWRAGTSGVTAFAAAYAGGGIGTALIPVPVVGTVAGMLIGLGLATVAELGVNPPLFELFGLTPKYHRVPLQ